MDEIIKLIKSEEKRQRETLTLIPSENFTSAAVAKAVGSGLANKYAEGYPQKRYYQGNKIIDQIEQLAIDRVKKLFGVPYVNVQPYSGSPANAAVLLALVAPGEKIMGMKLSAGGHLTHGHPVSFSGKFFKSVQYDVDESGRIDYEMMEKLVRAEKPKLVIAGTTAYPRIIDWARFARIADEVGAYFLTDISHIAGLVLGGEHPSPVPYADVIMSTTHKTFRGPRGAMLLVTEKGLKKDPDLAKKIDKGVFPGIQGGPHENVIAGIAIAAQEAGRSEYKKYIKQIVKNMAILSKELMAYGYNLTTGGTDNHLAVIDLRNKKVSGKAAAVALEEVGIVTNYNSIPHDTNPPNDPSGLRIGTPAVTTRGMKEKEMKIIASMIHKIISNSEFRNTKQGQKLTQNIKTEVQKLCRKFPV